MKGSELVKNLPPEVRFKYMANLKKFRQNDWEHVMEENYDDHNDMIECSFLWDKTPEGFEYWARISKIIKFYV